MNTAYCWLFSYYCPIFFGILVIQITSSPSYFRRTELYFTCTEPYSWCQHLIYELVCRSGTSWIAWWHSWVLGKPAHLHNQLLSVLYTCLFILLGQWNICVGLFRLTQLKTMVAQSSPERFSDFQDLLSLNTKYAIDTVNTKRN